MGCARNKIKETEDLELTGTCPLITHTGNKFEEYQLPTQKLREQQNKTTTTLQSFDCNLNSKKFGSKKNFKITDKILRLYKTPTEREIPLKRARIMAKNNAKEYRDLERSSLPLLDNGNHNFTRSNVNILQFSSNLVNDCPKRSCRHKRAELSPLATKSVTTDDSYLNKDKPCVSQLNKMIVLEKIRPCHPQFAKEITVKPEESLKINPLILAERLKVQLTQTPQNVTFPRMENSKKPVTDTPKYWWQYLNQKIAKKMSTPLPCLNKMCKLCELSSEHESIVRNSAELAKDMLHIDLKRLTEVRSKDWSSYGHYTRVHKLKYTKRRKNILKNKERQVEVDEDYLNVDVDTLMDIYKQKSNTDVVESRAIGDADIGNECPKENKETFFTSRENYSCLQRPATTKLRSCMNFTSRKTCFTSNGS